LVVERRPSSRAPSTRPSSSFGLRYGMILFHRLGSAVLRGFFWAFFDASLYPGELKQPVRAEVTGGIWPPPKGISIIAPFEPAADEHVDPAALGHDGDLGASRDHRG
jgi:hypothetical protein